ncbi:MAG: CopG family transcriptional regulator [Bowdeniella nasicola]|nr:CopG family transcriptional regulator [Bowdeniella nasicola]
MNASKHIETLEEALQAAAVLGGPQMQDNARALAAAANSGFRQATLALYDAIAQELNEQLAGVDVVVTVHDGEVSLRAEAHQAPTPPPTNDDGESTRTTVRMPANLRAEIEQAAKDSGVSINTWIIDALRSALFRRPTIHTSNSLTGWYS